MTEKGKNRECVTSVWRWLAYTLVVTLIAVWSCKEASGSDTNSTLINDRAQMLVFPCATCHGTDGKKEGVVPSLNELSGEYIEAALKGFRSGERSSTIMGRQTRGYTDEEIMLIADYYSRMLCNNRQALVKKTVTSGKAAER